MLKNFKFQNLLNFEVMLFPNIATVLYLLLAAISVLFGFAMVIRGIDMPWGGGPVIIGGLVMMIIGPLFIRLGFEVLLTFFKVHDKLRDISNKLNKPSRSVDATK